MCLDAVDKVPTVKEGTGYKGFWISDRGISAKLQVFDFEFNKWIEDTRHGIIGVYATYQTGFHLYKTRAEAREFYCDSELRKVKFRNVVATGRQSGQRVIVAREIYILPDKV